mmetsp:Transcript_111054/g.358529  ORF Transcript_111054/g.358529 Transcript_111054/m.358529 type:complete len:253 (+) Transcript_111054:754-1512(+)
MPLRCPSFSSCSNRSIAALVFIRNSAAMSSKLTTFRIFTYSMKRSTTDSSDPAASSSPSASTANMPRHESNSACSCFSFSSLLLRSSSSLRWRSASFSCCRWWYFCCLSCLPLSCCCLACLSACCCSLRSCLCCSFCAARRSPRAATPSACSLPSEFAGPSPPAPEPAVARAPLCIRSRAPRRRWPATACCSGFSPSPPDTLVTSKARTDRMPTSRATQTPPSHRSALPGDAPAIAHDLRKHQAIRENWAYA